MLPYPKNVPGNQYYHGKGCPIQYQIKEAEKHYEKFLIWQCLDLVVCASDWFVTTGTVTGKVYLKECLKKKLIPFTQKHCKIEKKHHILDGHDMAWHHRIIVHYCTIL